MRTTLKTMPNSSSDFETEKELFNDLLAAIRSQEEQLIKDRAIKLKSFLSYNTSRYKSSQRILEFLREKSKFSELYASIEKEEFSKEDLSYELTKKTAEKEDFCIALFTFNSHQRSSRVLESLKRSGAINDVEVFMDGPHAVPKLAKQVEENKRNIEKYNPKRINSRSGNYGFRRVMLESLLDLSSRYKKFIILEDDCFPTKEAITLFKKELNDYESDKTVLTVYGSHFLCDNEFPLCPRFQGWGWATWSKKIIPFIHKMMRLYLLPEKEYLHFINSTFTPSMKEKIDDLTHPRSCSFTTKKFFAWDETLTHLAALENKYHRPTSKRCIYNFGMDENSSHFPLSGEKIFRMPPFNLIKPEEVWKHF